MDELNLRFCIERGQGDGLMKREEASARMREKTLRQEAILLACACYITLLNFCFFIA